MSTIDFNLLPDTARLWIYGSSRQFDGAQAEFIMTEMQNFIHQWVSHKKDVTAGWELHYERFILIGVDESATEVSGCSIDSMVHFLRSVEKELETEIADSNAWIFYRDASNTIQCVSRQEFEQLVEKAVVHEDTIVFDNTIQTVAGLRENKWEVPAKSSWHIRLFGAVAPHIR